MLHLPGNFQPASPNPAPRAPFRLKRRPEERVRLLGCAMDMVKPPEVFRFVEGVIGAGRKAIVANHNLHSLYLTKKDAEVRRFFEMADLIEIDSTPLIAWARLIGENSRGFHRCTYLDWRDDFWARASAQGWRVYFLGSAEGVAEQAAQRICAQHPGVNLRTHHGYFDISEGSAENAAVVADIEAFAPQILLVGMGMPRQEVWIARNYERLPTCVMFSVGGAFDYEAGVQKPCPRWMGRIGVEWLFRLASNPSRLFNRYCIEPWSLVGPALDDLRHASRRRNHAQARRSEIRYLPPRPNAGRQERKLMSLDG